MSRQTPLRRAPSEHGPAPRGPGRGSPRTRERIPRNELPDLRVGEKCAFVVQRPRCRSGGTGGERDQRWMRLLDVPLVLPGRVCQLVCAASAV